MVQDAGPGWSAWEGRCPPDVMAANYGAASGLRQAAIWRETMSADVKDRRYASVKGVEKKRSDEKSR